jgi:hypothetical protein
MDEIVLDEIESVFPDKAANDLTKTDLESILRLERKHKKHALFYTAKNQDSTPDIFYVYYNRQSDEAIALSEGLVKGYVICKFNNCDRILNCPSGSIKY